MKKYLESLKRQDGFTLVELMVVVAIIGLLSAVAIPNFKKYQAKSKVSEAKLQLSALYTAESAFMSDYNMYAACLRYMGYDPARETAARYYAVGFPGGGTNRNTDAHTSAVGSGMDPVNCPATSGAIDGGDTANLADGTAVFFRAGKGVGGAIIDTAAEAANNAAGTHTAASCVLATAVAQTGPGSCVGDQSSNLNLSFSAAAVGVISQDFATDALASGLNINHNKVISVRSIGY